MKKLILLIAILISSIAFGQKAIEINGQIKVYNILPREWNTESGVKILNFRTAATEQNLYDLGFRDFIRPAITNYQKYGILLPEHLTNDVYIYPIIDFTQKEIDVYNQQQLDNDSSALKLFTYKDEGQLWNKRIWDRIMREYDDGNITNNQFEGISITLFDALLPLELGLWKVAKSKVDAITPPSNATLLAILNKVKEIIDNYITQNY